MRLDADRFWCDDTALVLLAGQPPASEWLLKTVAAAPYVAAADGGAAIALAAGRRPDLLIGDFDSLAAEALAACREAGCEILTLPAAKDLTDGEFLLQTLYERGWRRFLVLGALGGRVDQMLANIACAEKLARAGAEVLLAHDDAVLCLLYAESTPQELTLHGFAGKTLSLLSISEVCDKVELAGFEYPLNGRLARRQTLGISNVVRAEAAALRLTGGSLLVCLNL